MDGEISADELETALDSDDPPTVVDIRDPPAFEGGHIPGSVNIPFPRLTARIEQVADEEHVVTVCPHGKASVKAARLITSFEGFDGRVDSLETGLSGWNGPVEHSSDREESQEPDAPF